MEDETFYRMVDEAIRRIRAELSKPNDEWIDGDEVMKILKITSRTTLQKFRDEGKIRYSQPEKKIILYYRPSVIEFIEKHAKETFR